MKLKYVGESGIVPTVGMLVQGEEYNVEIFSKKVLQDFKNRNLLVPVASITKAAKEKE